MENPEIDAVCIATPDHWHAYMVVEAMKAGKDVYSEKPLTHAVDEAKVILAASAKYGRILQTGAMQRSGIEFRTACEVVRNGGIGDIRGAMLGGFILGIVMAILGVAELERYMKEMKDEERGVGNGKCSTSEEIH